MDGEVVRVSEGEGGERGLLALPGPESLPGGGVRVREAVAGDLGFIDRLQKKHSKAVGWMPRGQLEGHIGKGHVLVAEAIKGSGNRDQGSGGRCETGMVIDRQPDPRSPNHGPSPAPSEPVGYCIGVDKYFKREDVGIIYQMNVAPGRQRGLIGATLLQAMFDRWPYGVRLCCCWCAQDLEANKFWEAMGFVPLAFRAGGYGKTKAADLAKGVFKGRVHIFWQKKIRFADQGTGNGDQGSGSASGDASDLLSCPDPRSQDPGPRRPASPIGYWFPSQTGSGAIREDRVVLPIPPGVHWSEAKPAVLPGMAGVLGELAAEREAEVKRLAPSAEALKAERQREREARKRLRLETVRRSGTVGVGGVRFGGGGSSKSGNAENAGSAGNQKKKRKKAKASGGRVALKNDPRLVAAARELRDRWLEHAAKTPGLIEAGNTAARRYDVGKMVEGPGGVMGIDRPMEPARGVRVVEAKRLDAV